MSRCGLSDRIAFVAYPSSFMARYLCLLRFREQSCVRSIHRFTPVSGILHRSQPLGVPEKLFKQIVSEE